MNILSALQMLSTGQPLARRQMHSGYDIKQMQ